MVANLEKLSEAVDLATLDRKLADAIETRKDEIQADIDRQGYSDVTVEGKTFRITNKAAAA
jgi:hypothetical protein